MLMGLDVSSAATGWAVLTADRRVACGTIHAVGDGWARAPHFCRELRRLIVEAGITHVAMEEPLRSNISAVESKVVDGGMFGPSILSRKRFTTSMSVLRALYAWAGYVHLVAEGLGVHVVEVHQGTWRKHFLGVGSAPKGAPKGWLKDQAMRRAMVLGHTPDSPDAAEAIGVLDWLAATRGAKLPR